MPWAIFAQKMPWAIFTVDCIENWMVSSTDRPILLGIIIYCLFCIFWADFGETHFEAFFCAKIAQRKKIRKCFGQVLYKIQKNNFKEKYSIGNSILLRTNLLPSEPAEPSPHTGSTPMCGNGPGESVPISTVPVKRMHRGTAFLSSAHRRWRGNGSTVACTQRQYLQAHLLQLQKCMPC